MFGIENEEEIKECDIYINDIKIDFTYYYNFPKEGYYKIKYIFKKLLYSANYMFYRCASLISLDLSNFNSINVTNMENMFCGCHSLISLDLSSFNTQNVTNMCFMFSDCFSLISLDLSNFNINNLKYVDDIFNNCYSLITIDLSNFNLNKILNLCDSNIVFHNCNSLLYKYKNYLNYIYYLPYYYILSDDEDDEI